MLREKQIKTNIGIVIGRFQVNKLTAGHIQLIDSVLEKHKKVAIFIGSTPTLMVTRRQPMDYQTRMLMIQEKYPEVICLPIKDYPSDYDWSEAIDSDIERIFEGVSENKDATLYGSRDGFIPYYHGKYKTIELEETIDISGRQVRQMVSEEVRKSSDFRRGVIYAAYNKHPVNYTTVDIACMKNEGKDEFGLDNKYIALVRKKNDIKGKWRFPGGFVSPNDDSFESAAKREFSEETNLEADDFKFVRSFRVDDWRYKKEVDGIMTSLFVCTYVFGAFKASDDVSDQIWFQLNKLKNIEDIKNNIVPDHVPLMEHLIKSLSFNNNPFVKTKKPKQLTYLKKGEVK